LRDPPLDGPTNMARDEALLYCERVAPAALRIYFWDPPTISLGYFQRFTDVAKLPADVRDLPIVRRATGGGAILHDREITYSLLLDESIPIARKAPVELYRTVHDCWRTVLVQAGFETSLAPEEFPMPSPRSGPFFCFERPGRTDLLHDGAKLLGSAQRRIPGRVLQHGSLMLEQRFRTHPGADLHAPSHNAAESWIEQFISELSERLHLIPQPQVWSDALLADADQRRERYACAEWTQRR